MGNCLESLTSHQQAGRSDREKAGEQAEQQQKKAAGTDHCAKDGGGGGGFEKDGGFRVKILLTKEELEWLLLQLKEKGGKRLEDVLMDIERGRGRSTTEGWKPSLESIMEGPEAQTIDREGL